MASLFLKLFNMSMAASWLILAVIVLRLVLKRAPKWIHCVLWALVAVRLLCPISIESALSLIPSSEPLPPEVVQFDPHPAIHSGVTIIDNAVNPVMGEAFAASPEVSVNPLYIWTEIAAIVWAIGVVVLLAYAAISYFRLRRVISESAPLWNNIYLCDHIQTPFILGVVRPRVYLPSDLSDAQMQSVVAHERAHLARRDHWWKPLGWALLTVYWFNPLCWVAYILLCRDIELACDEKVISDMGIDDRKAYSQALLSCSISRRLVSACPLAFGEVGVKERIKGVLNYKKPTFWVIALAVVACIAAAVCFLTNPKDEHKAEPVTPAGLSAEEWNAILSKAEPYSPQNIAIDPVIVSVDSAGEILCDRTLPSGIRIVCYCEPGSEYVKYWAVRNGDSLTRFCQEESGYREGYDVEDFSDVLGQSGFRILAPRGSAYFAYDYYVMGENGVPQLLAECANQVEEVDINHDGELDLRWYYHGDEKTYFYFRQNGQMYFSVLNINEISSQERRDFNEQRANYIFKSFGMKPQDYTYVFNFEVNSYIDASEYVSMRKAMGIQPGTTAPSFFLNDDTIYCVLQDQAAVNYLYHFAKNADGTWFLRDTQHQQDIARYPNDNILSDTDSGLFELMGLTCWYVDKETEPGYFVRTYYTKGADGLAQLIAESCSLNRIDNHIVDLDGDGIMELVCNDQWPNGVERTYVFRRKSSIVEVGCLSWDMTDLPGFVNLGNDAVAERYDAASSQFILKYATGINTYQTRAYQYKDFTFEEFIVDHPKQILWPHVTADNLFASMPSTFHFLSGAGGWQTELYWYGNGKFSGIFEDADAGSMERCEFAGAFSAPRKVRDLLYSTHMTKLTYAEPGVTTTENDIKVTTAGPYGLEGADELWIYLPGYPVSELPESVLSWIRGGASEFWDGQTPDTLPFFVLYNLVGEEAFFSADWSAFAEANSTQIEQTYQDIDYELTIIGTDWQYMKTQVFDTICQRWSSYSNPDVSLTVRRMGQRDLAAAQDWERTHCSKFSLVEDKQGGLFGESDQNLLDIQFYQGQNTMYAVELRYPMEAAEGFGAELQVIRDTFQLTK